MEMRYLRELSKSGEEQSDEAISFTCSSLRLLAISGIYNETFGG